MEIKELQKETLENELIEVQRKLEEKNYESVDELKTLINRKEKLLFRLEMHIF